MSFQMLSGDLSQLIGSYLLEDKTKTIHKIFFDKKDDALKVLLFGEVKDLNYIDINDKNNEIPYTNNMIMKFVNNFLKKKNEKTSAARMNINFFHDEIQDRNIIKICCYTHDGLKIAEITDGFPLTIISKYVFIHFLCGNLHPNFPVIWGVKVLNKKLIVREYKTIQEEIIKKYFEKNTIKK